MYQKNKLECVNENLALNTNLYGMGTRSTDSPGFASQELLIDALNSIKSGKELQEIELSGNKFVTILQACSPSDRYYYLNTVGSSCNGRQIILSYQEYSDLIRTNGSLHEKATFVTNGEYTYIITSDGLDGFIYLVNDYRFDGYLICIEDLAGNNLDFNDCIIYGAPGIYPKIIFRRASLPLSINFQGHHIILEGNTDEIDYNQELPFTGMNTPNDWKDVIFIANSV